MRRWPTFYGEGGEEWFINFREYVGTSFRLALQRDLTPDEQWELDGLIEKLAKRKPSPHENKLLKHLIEGR